MVGEVESSLIIMNHLMSASTITVGLKIQMTQGQLSIIINLDIAVEVNSNYSQSL